MLNSSLARNSLVIIAVVVTAYALYWMRGILTPLALAVFLLVMIDGLARGLCRRAPFIPEWAALPVALLLSCMALATIVYAVAANAPGFAAQLIDAAPPPERHHRRDRPGHGGSRAPHHPGADQPAQPDPIPGQRRGPSADLRLRRHLRADLPRLPARLAFRLPEEGPGPLSRNSEREHATAIFVRIRNGVERYLWIQTVSGAIIASLSWGVMAALGLESAVFWAFLIFVVCFIPVLGGLVAGILPALFALVQFPDWWQAAALFAGLQTILFAVGNVLLPRMQRDNLNIDPVVVLLSLAFWGAIWGVTGMFLSTPLTVTGIIIMAQFPGSRWIAVLLSGDGDPEAEPLRQPARLPGPGGAAAT
jgi:predicted PurR-regulated permease PerM